MKISFTVNKRSYQIEINPAMRLVDLLRETLGLTGTKEGCGIGECGACTVIMNGRAVNACLVNVAQVDGAKIQTIDSLDQDAVLTRLQKAFLEHGAVQCGFCTPGMLMSAKALLDANPSPTLEEIKTALEGNLCRCTGYAQIVNAVQDAAAAS
jgi:carbon-monoxide dehydrogenase small subunit